MDSSKLQPRCATQRYSFHGLLYSVLVTAALLTAGCARLHAMRGPASSMIHAGIQCDTATARQKHQRALVYLGNPHRREHHVAKAKKLLEEALIADVRFGPAHNNLGQIYFQEGDYYQAAWKFESAADLMPERPEPLNNLGLVYETVDRNSHAISYFQLAHELAPSNPIYLGNLIRAMLQDEQHDPLAIDHLLSELLLIETRPEWRAWAREQRSAMMKTIP